MASIKWSPVNCLVVTGSNLLPPAVPSRFRRSRRAVFGRRLRVGPRWRRRSSPIVALKCHFATRLFKTPFRRAVFTLNIKIAFNVAQTEKVWKIPSLRSQRKERKKLKHVTRSARFGEEVCGWDNGLHQKPHCTDKHNCNTHTHTLSYNLGGF